MISLYRTLCIPYCRTVFCTVIPSLCVGGGWVGVWVGGCVHACVREVPGHLIDIIEEMYTGTWCQVKTDEGSSEEFKVESGVRQGCVLSPLLFNCFKAI